jgi:hypothetical protein
MVCLVAYGLCRVLILILWQPKCGLGALPDGVEPVQCCGSKQVCSMDMESQWEGVLEVSKCGGLLYG